MKQLLQDSEAERVELGAQLQASDARGRELKEAKLALEEQLQEVLLSDNNHGCTLELLLYSSYFIPLKYHGS